MPKSLLMNPASALTFKVPSFEGPLDLLLHLVREHRVDIYDIPIASIAEQYLATMALWESMDLAVAGEYLVMAATLIEIKSRLLLPLPPPPEGESEVDDPRAELIRRLVEYQTYQATVDTLRHWEEDRRLIYFRGALENPDDYVLPTPAGALSGGALLKALQQVLQSAGVEDQAVTAVIPRRRLSLRMKMAEIARRIRDAEVSIRFEDLFELPCPRYEIVLTFLALLELLRQGKVKAEQENEEASIMLSAVITE